jgi:hypothetical protein
VSIVGTVLVDGQPVDTGTLRLEPVEGTAGKGVGGSIQEGSIQMAPNCRLVPGKYLASAVVFRGTGRKINDYQRGPIEETVQLSLQDSPHPIELTPENARDLTIEFTTSSGH